MGLLKNSQWALLLLVLVMACASKEPAPAPRPSDVPKEGASALKELPIRIGVLLPLSGPYAPFGEAVLNGMTCAMGLFVPCGSEALPIQMIVKDTQGEAEQTTAAVQQLIEEEKVSALIGPLLSQEASSAASQAESKNIPLILLSPQKTELSQRNFIFQLALTPQREVEEIAAKSAALGLEDFILFYPENRYGEEYKTLFEKALSEGKVIAQMAYAPDLPDFTGVVEGLLQKTNVKKVLAKGGHTVGLFIPDSFRQVIKIAEALNNFSVAGLKLVGTSRWFHPKLLSYTLPPLEGALLDTPFFPDAASPVTSQFTINFLGAYGNRPAWLEALGFDAMRLLIHAIQDTGNSYPPDIRNTLHSLQNFPAAVGALSWDKEGVAQWPLDFITVAEGKFVRLD